MQRSLAPFVVSFMAVLAVALIVAAAPALGQSDARLAIKVTDPEGDPVPGASVTVVSLSQGSEREFVTDEDGEHLQRGFRPDTYRITVEAEGYAPQQQEVRMSLGMNAVDIVLPPASTAGPTEEEAEHLNSLQEQGIEAYRAGEYRTAIDAMESLLEGLEGIEAEGLEEVRGQALRVLGDSYLQEDEPEQAVSAYERLLEASPESPDVLMGLGQAYARMDELESSLEYFERAMEAAPEDPVAHFNAGIVLLQTDHLEEAVAAMEKATELRPEFPLAHKQLGYAYARDNELEKAVEAFRTYLEQEPEAADRADIEGMITALETELARQEEQQEQL